MSKSRKKGSSRSKKPSAVVQLNEVCPATGISTKDYVRQFVSQNRPLMEVLRTLRVAKRTGTRPKPSTRLIGEELNFSINDRGMLLDKVAALVDENLFGRSDMCAHFALLLAKALELRGVQAVAKCGKVDYLKPDGTFFSWDHAWVEYDDVVIDGNVDSMVENPHVPSGMLPAPFWGTRDHIPEDRFFQFDSAEVWHGDEDTELWWLRLQPKLNSLPHSNN